MHEPAIEDPARRGRVRAAWAASAVVVAAGVALVFAPILGHGFINLDDPEYVTDNPQVRSGLSLPSVGWAFNVGHAGNWHPLTWLSHMTDVAMFGLDPAGHHATSLLLHVANALLVFLLLRRVVAAAIPADRRLDLRATVAVAALATLVFAIHPLRIESVAWVAERKDVLSGLFGLASVLAYLRRADRPGWRADAQRPGDRRRLAERLGGSESQGRRAAGDRAADPLRQRRGLALGAPPRQQG